MSLLSAEDHVATSGLGGVAARMAMISGGSSEVIDPIESSTTSEGGQDMDLGKTFDFSSTSLAWLVAEGGVVLQVTLDAKPDEVESDADRAREGVLSDAERVPSGKGDVCVVMLREGSSAESEAVEAKPAEARSW
jgi:hypothetical protein